MENVRSFCGKHTTPVRPLTLLVGENSSGKSTFLAMLAQLCDSRFPSLRPTFNNSPFDLGNFESIATFKCGKRPASQSFSVGMNASEASGQTGFLASYTNIRNQPQLFRYHAAGRGSEITFELDPQTLESKIFVKTSTGKQLHGSVGEPQLHGGSDLILTLLLQAALYGVMAKEETST